MSATIITTQEEIKQLVKDALKEALNEIKDSLKEEPQQFFDDELLTRKQVMKILKISKSTFFNWVYAGKLKARKMKNGEYRVKYKDLQDVIYND